MKRVKAVIGILLILALGALGGSLVTGHFMKQRLRGYFQGPAPVLAIILRRMSHELDLTPGQREKIRPILEATRTRMTALREKYRPEFQASFEEATREIRSILTEAQRPKLDHLREKMKHRRRGIGPGGPPGPPPVESVALFDRILNLAEDQKIKAHPLLDRSIKHQQALRSAMQREREAFLARIDSLATDGAERLAPIESQLAGILDAEQMAEYRRAMGPGGRRPPKRPFHK